MATAVIEAMECCGDRLNELEVAMAINLEGAMASGLSTDMAGSVVVAIVLHTSMTINFGAVME